MTRLHTHAHEFTHVTRYSREWHARIDTHDHDRTLHVGARRRVSVSEGETALIFTFIRSLRSQQSIPDCIVFTVSNRLKRLSR